MQKTKVSACIVVYGGGEEAAQAARSLVEHTRDAALSLTLVDNASPDGAGEWLAAQQLGPGVKVVRLPENVGFGSGHNTVLPQLDSVYHFVVNPDITLDDDAVSKLCAWMDAHPDVVMATPRLLFPNGAEQYTAKRRPSFLALLARQVPLPFLKGVERHYLMQDEDLSCPQEIEFCTGCFFVMRTEAFRRMGYRPEYITINWTEKNALLESGAIDCIWGCFSMSGREDEYTWAGPYMYSHQVVAVMPDSDIQTLADLAGKTVVVQATTKPESLFLDGNDPRIPEIRALHSLQKQELIYSHLAKGYADAVATHEISLLQYMADYGAEFRILEEPLEVVGLGVAFSRSDDRGIAQALCATLEQMRTDGTTRSILASYLADPDKYLEADGYAD